MGSSDAGTRQGVCAGIQEVLQNVTRQQLGDMLPTMLPTIQTALCDDNDAVRTVPPAPRPPPPHPASAHQQMSFAAGGPQDFTLRASIPD